ncbi:hypothetical protein [Planktothrix paucivesiculata]|uniref:Peptide chain release factor 2 n=1 Tax=Planktothrix paucivesiculata PCC 9631 TaxID=671071 RepID=A0A7Z9BEI0_9CYAN|nr:hypothetical protein [Planktothrix paucivesiculata]VXD10723.1 Peptide chain release factor 2 [Planktothrix paucivesiculata PCC 9631]
MLTVDCSPISAKIKSVPFRVEKRLAIAMDVLEIKREIELLSERLGKTQDYL